MGLVVAEVGQVDFGVPVDVGLAIALAGGPSCARAGRAEIGLDRPAARPGGLRQPFQRRRNVVEGVQVVDEDQIEPFARRGKLVERRDAVETKEAQVSESRFHTSIKRVAHLDRRNRSAYPPGRLGQPHRRCAAMGA